MSSFAERARAGVTRLTASEREEWLDFLRRQFGPEARQAHADWLRWLARNPDADGEIHAWITRRNGGIVGSQGSIPFTLHELGRAVPAAWAVDLMVDAAWRLRGVGPALVQAQTESSGLVASIGVSDAAYRAYLRGGWLDLGDIPTYIRPFDLAWAARQAGLGRVGGHAARAVGRLVLALTGGAATAVAAAMGGRLEEVDRFDARVDAVWDVAARRHQVIATRNLEALQWRFDAVPDASRLRRFYLVRDGTVVAYAVTRVESWRDRPIFVILDYLATERLALVALLARLSALDDARATGALMCRALDGRNDPAFRAAGFVRIDGSGRQSGLSPTASTPIRFMVHRGSGADRAAYRRALWFVTSGDSDVAMWHTAGGPAGPA